ncbi:unnamed protein product [Aphanomyces euteiches]|uniref:Uncharacterized protein n=1 Tax=Aphanomyces euteiches TaxID=100861 RepID=A0A6G0XYD3_9STRA|nr:hypothetical protein Ae201684_000207 [Aphanomyces euteiches]KAH9091620.1 hypothetical protein Ae201684P_011164 [Aphanomyces euteiches]KAH9129535.1 hypothetical protein AeMF1_000410 [Aphanomyces euteiches]KAH9137424.1 hypothetical protein LEN26_005750 [Aphanomyces euteiches]KAH9157331.1 hypothetical protein AeRB84_000803 [Aphanomyces euteiches]
MDEDATEKEVQALQLQITELNRLLFSTADGAKRKSLEQQIEALEEEGIALRKKAQDERELYMASRLNTARPASARPKRTTLKPVIEDSEVPQAHLTAELARRHFTNIINLDNDIIRDIVTPSHNDKYPVTSVIESGCKTYWMSTGMYPQMLKFMLRQTVYIASVEITCLFVKELVVHCTHSRSVVNPEPVRVILPPPSDEMSSPNRVTHKFKFEGDAIETIEVRILSGYIDFCIVHVVKIKVDENVDTSISCHIELAPSR